MIQCEIQCNACQRVPLGNGNPRRTNRAFCVYFLFFHSDHNQKGRLDSIQRRRMWLFLSSLDFTDGISACLNSKSYNERSRKFGIWHQITLWPSASTECGIFGLENLRCTQSHKVKLMMYDHPFNKLNEISISLIRTSKERGPSLPDDRLVWRWFNAPGVLCEVFSIYPWPAMRSLRSGPRSFL